MRFLDSFFGRKHIEEDQPNIKFGRYSDAYKGRDHYEAWDKSLALFEEKNYIDSYIEFLKFLYDEHENNVKWEKKDGGLSFEILQGSNRIIGFANVLKLKVEAKVAKADVLNINFMRRLMERNFKLEYSRYCLDEDNHITIVFDTYVLDGSPYKLYYALKEVATKADKLDDLLLDEFQMLKAIDTSLQIPISNAHKHIKYQFIQAQIKLVFDEIDNGKLDKEQYPGAIAYLLLDLCYKLDYLIKPEGFTMEALERIHRLYFAKNGKNMARKNEVLCKEFQQLLQRPEEDYFKEMYRVNSTFGITVPVNHDRVKNFISGEIGNMDWYQEHGRSKIACAISGYIVGYCLFYYAIPKPDLELFHLYYQIMNADYFSDLGFSPKYYNTSTKEFDKKAIKHKIRSIQNNNEAKYDRLKPNTKLLKYSSLDEFAKSYLMMIQTLDLTKS
ncbi:MAG TPA: hypothetical protein ENK52_02230 [Saprospiraceae bacterium]|nr:hypothetical protein [Saprospiraceae bacterium]